MRIGDLSERAGPPAHQLRAWECRYGLLQPRRSAGNDRLYSPADEARVRLMQRYLAEGVPPAQAAELTIAARFAVSVGSGDAVPLREVATAHKQMARSLARFDETSAQRTLERLLACAVPLFDPAWYRPGGYRMLVCEAAEPVMRTTQPAIETGSSGEIKHRRLSHREIPRLGYSGPSRDRRRSFRAHRCESDQQRSRRSASQSRWIDWVATPLAGPVRCRRGRPYYPSHLEREHAGR